MADASKKDSVAPAQGRTVRFTPSVGAKPGAVNGFDVLAPPQEQEPAIAQGIDLSGRPKVVFAAGRGKTGKTTLLRWLTETSLAGGSEIILADVDPTHAAFSVYFENVSRPETDDPVGVREWLVELLEFAANERQSAVIDLGGGDTSLRGIAAEMPGICDALEEAGIAPVIFYVAGREPEDLVPALTLAQRGFVPRAQAVVINEYARPVGKPRSEAFARLLASAAFETLSQAAIPLWMPRLFAAEAVEVRHCGFRAALEGRCDPPLGIANRTRLHAWLQAMDRRFAGVKSWLP